jgi:hypothetical protein
MKTNNVEYFIGRTAALVQGQLPALASELRLAAGKGQINPPHGGGEKLPVVTLQSLKLLPSPHAKK